NLSTIFKVTASDTTATQTHTAPVGTNQPITNVFDYNRDGAVGAADITLDQTHGTTNSTGLVVINIGSGGPFAPMPGAASTTSSGNGGVASALATSASSPSQPVPPIPAWIDNRPSHLELNHGLVAKYFEHLEYERTVKAEAVLITADLAADAHELDNEFPKTFAGWSMLSGKYRVRWWPP
ncbi:MAG TPA: hypothetical protein VGZ26_08335, partial [Pirellulales bacterium]|nr:hypothetical protein [Pirellulales bacterium]